MNLPPARVWCYRPAREFVALAEDSGHKAIIRKIRGGAHKVRDEILEKRDRIETEFRLVRDRMRSDFEMRAERLRKELDMKPAMALWKKINQNKRKGR